MRASPALAVVLLGASSVPGGEVAPRAHAIVGARIVVAPGHVLESGTIVLRDGLIAAVGPSVPVPPDARIWESEGLTVYPGLIDAFVTPAAPPSPAPTAAAAAPVPPRPEPAPPVGSRGAAHVLPSVTPDRRVVESPLLAKEQVEALRATGFAVAQVAPANGIVRGQSAVVALTGATPNQSVVRADVAQVVAFDPERQAYPGSLMGAVAVVRQAFRDAAWYRDRAAAYARAPERAERPEANLAWAALERVLARKQPVLFVADEMLEVLRAGVVAREAAVNAQVVGAGDEYKRAKEIAALGLPLIVPVSFLEAPDVSDPDSALEVGIEELRHFDQGPGNPAALSRAGVTFALTTHGLKDTRAFRANVARAIERGLEPDRALAAVTTIPARLLGLEDRLGTLAVGKAANLTLTRGDLFAPKSRVREVWVEGQRFEVLEKDEPGAKGRFELAWSGTKGTLTLAPDKEPTAKVAVGGETIHATDVRLDGPRASFTLTRGGLAERFDLTERRDRLTGSVLSANGIAALTGFRSGEAEPDKPKDDEKGPAEPAKPDPKPVETPVVMGNSEPWRMALPEAPAALLVKNATLWTAGPQGTVAGADLLVRAGKIAAVGKGLAAPPGAVTKDATGRHVVPGMIDAHSHSAILGSVNECTNSVTAEVRVEDAINSESVNIYRQLAGGTTVMHLLHGSCNSVGGQSALIKNKWGEPPDRLRIADAPPTIKFALGENPKRSYSAGFPGPEGRRYPATRAGVEQVIREAFTRARDYQEALAEFRTGRRLVAPRPDLQSEALLEVLDGKRLIHSHAYRQDEILMLMRLTEEFGIRVQTFQHILEGYKVADEMAAHGASGSGFSDWWAYKFEVIDAIPYNGFLMWDRGVSVSYNSDSDELARILNVEAAKAMKYGGVPADEALRFVTLNPARQLKIDDRVGSLEVGKDADFSIRTESPLSPTSRVQETWIEGRKYFDRDADLAGRAALAREREALVAKARAARKAKPLESGGNRSWPPRYLDDADVSGDECGDALSGMPFRGEARR
jgi:imidazolonepropionase-like amidohydrolase